MSEQRTELVTARLLYGPLDGGYATVAYPSPMLLTVMRPEGPATVYRRVWPRDDGTCDYHWIGAR